MNILYLYNEKDLKEIPLESVVDKLYFQDARLPIEKEIKKYIKDGKNKKIVKYLKENSIDDMKRNISGIDNKIPLYDVYKNNMFIITRDSVYKKVIYEHFRLLDNKLLSQLEKRMDNLEMKLDGLKNARKGSKEEHDKILLERKHRKLKLIIEFMGNYDIGVLENTYTNIFYYYANEVGKNITLCKRPSFLPHLTYINPYYTRSELINMGLNMGLIERSKKIYNKEEVMKLCGEVSSNDISSDIILDHQNHIIDKNKIGIIKYYSQQGSYFMNKYLRTPTYKNKHMEVLIKSMWNLITTAPKFDKSYYLYRFMGTDEHLDYLRVGDEYITEGFTSTTRDPFYQSEEYKFGFILVKIKIPKNVKGVALSIETFSQFPKEEEIILPPKTKLRLDRKDVDTMYYHTDPKFTLQVRTRYEFTLIGRESINFKEREEVKKNKLVDFLEIKDTITKSVDEKIKQFTGIYVNKLKQFDVKIGKHRRIVFMERYDSTSVYRDLYAVKTQHGLSMYSIDASHMEFMVEIGEGDEGSYMHINYYLRNSITTSDKKYTDDEFIMFLCKLAYYFDAETIFLYTDYVACDKKNNYGGNYCIDFYEYLKYGKRKYAKLGKLEVKAAFGYYYLDKMKKESPLTVLRESDTDELYQIYRKIYKLYGSDNLSDFYVWVIDNYCYLQNALVKKMGRMFKGDNPFKKDYYILDPIAYLYNRDKIYSYSKNRIDDVEEIKLDKNEYRIETMRIRDPIN